VCTIYRYICIYIYIYYIYISVHDSVRGCVHYVYTYIDAKSRFIVRVCVVYNIYIYIYTFDNTLSTVYIYMCVGGGYERESEGGHKSIPGRVVLAACIYIHTDTRDMGRLLRVAGMCRRRWPGFSVYSGSNSSSSSSSSISSISISII
jgi:hypothetical protein